MLHAWAAYRHPNKGKQWIAHRYWRMTEEHGWIFQPPQGGPHLYRHRQTLIRRHVKVHSAAMLLLPGVSILLLISIAGESIAAGNAYYASPSGRGSACSNSSPCSVDTGLGKLSPGDTLYLKRGTYTQTIGYDPTSPWNYPNPSTARVIPSGTSWSNVVTIKAAPGETPITQGWYFHQGHYIEVDGENRMVLDGQSRPDSFGILVGDDHIRLKNFELKNFTRIAILGGCSFCEYINLHVHHNGSHGLYTEGPALVDGGEWHHMGGGVVSYGGYGLHFYPNPHDITVRNVSIHDNLQGGIFSRNNISVSNSLIYNNRGNGIWHNRAGRFFNNTIYSNGEAGLRCKDGNEIRNNIVYSNGGGSITCSGNHSNNFTSDPRFVDRSGGDFHLQAGSPAIDAGMPLPEVPCDFDGNKRPAGSASDIGAYEQGGSPSAGCSKGGVSTSGRKPMSPKKAKPGRK
jgi:hypothetical protein